jgi:hypothetical protein
MKTGDVVVIFVGGVNIIGRLQDGSGDDKVILSEPSFIRPTGSEQIGVYPLGGSLFIQPSVLTFRYVPAYWPLENKDMIVLYERFEEEIKSKRAAIRSNITITNMMPTDPMPG